MDCYLHPGTSSTATCVSCAQPICYYCREDVAGHPMCKPCVAAASARLADAASPAPATAPTATTTPAPDYGAPAPAAEAAPPAAQTIAPPVGVAPSNDARPGVMRRIGRGLLWGLVYGQWWTILTIFCSFAWGHGGVGVAEGIFLAFFYGFFGSIAGLIIGAANLSLGAGTMVGVGVGVLVCFIEMALSHSASSLVNIFFYFFTGRFVGSGITWRVQQPVK